MSASSACSAKTSKPGDAQVTPPFLHLDDDVGRPHENDVEAAVADDGRFVLAVAGSTYAVSGRLQELDDPVVEVALGGESQPDGVDRAGVHLPRIHG